MPPERSPQSRNRARDRSSDRSYTLDELCALGNVTVRTVRYYISEGLLPPPTGHGTTARYGQDHLDRLVVVGAMKARYLPLREIRRSLDAMSVHDIGETAGLVRQQSEEADAEESPDAAVACSPMLAAPLLEPERDRPARMAIREASSAADYIAEVLDQPTHRSGHPRHRSSTPDPDATAWRRVPITAEAELLIEDETYTRRREQIESLVAWAQRILNGT